MTIKKNICLLSILLNVFSVYSENINYYEVKSPDKAKVIYNGHLNLGGISKDNKKIEFNSFYMSVDDIPVIPIMGEFHYCRYPHEQWEEAILTMKSGGITVIPTYVFWNIHEEKEGHFDWSGNKDLRKFIELCQKHDMKVVVRIGPFCHGEIRNGGLPDWLFARPIDVRSNDPDYLKYVKRLYTEISRQLEGLYFKDGGPIIGTQIENEHQHSAAPWAICYPGERKDYTSSSYDKSITKIGVSVQDSKISKAELGERHMLTLKKMAQEVGIITPLYTVTGWGNAAVLGYDAIPVTAAYTYPFWAKPFKSPFCLFKDIQKYPDYSPVRYDTEKYPSFCAEMGVGIQMIYSSRPIVKAEAAEALMIRTLGSGANGIGYYMYHGGSTPKSCDGSMFMSDEPMGVPKISYDFQAPVGEFGLARDSYKYLRTIHSFVKDFGCRLATMETVLPEGNDKITPDNREQLRFAVRMKDDSGFIFMTNFQDHDTARIDQENLVINLDLNNENVRVPSKGTFTLKKDESAIFPFNFDMDGALLKYATAQLLTKIDVEGGSHYFFFAPEGISPQFLFDDKSIKNKDKYYFPKPGIGSTFEIINNEGHRIKVTTLTKKEALNTVKLNNKLIISDSQVLFDKNKLVLLNLGDNKFKYIIYPSADGLNWKETSVQAVDPKVEVNKKGYNYVSVDLKQLKPLSYVNEYFMNFDYVGDVAMASIDGKMVLDHFYYGSPWIIGLKRFSKSLSKHNMDFYIRPLYRNVPFWNDLPYKVQNMFDDNQVLCGLENLNIIPQYKIELDIY